MVSVWGKHFYVFQNEDVFLHFAISDFTSDSILIIVLMIFYKFWQQSSGHHSFINTSIANKLKLWQQSEAITQLVDICMYIVNFFYISSKKVYNQIPTLNYFLIYMILLILKFKMKFNIELKVQENLKISREIHFLHTPLVISSINNTAILILVNSLKARINNLKLL